MQMGVKARDEVLCGGGGGLSVERECDHDIDAQCRKQYRVLIRGGQATNPASPQYVCRVRPERQHDRLLVGSMRPGGQALDDFLVAAVNAVEDTDG